MDQLEFLLNENRDLKQRISALEDKVEKLISADIEARKQISEWSESWDNDNNPI
jgi:cell division septum initiation protein DivIVA